MKKVTVSNAYKFFLAFIFSCIQMFAWAQDSTGTTTTTSTTSTTTTSTQWYMQPWAWIAGGVLVLIIIIALLRGNSTREVTRTTVIKDDRT